MEIEKNDNRIEFADDCNYSCTIDSSNGSLRFSFSWECDGSAYFSQEDIKQLLPYLQSFAETGTLEPATESTLQGDSLLEESIKKTASLVRHATNLEFEITTMQEAGVAMVQNIVDQGKRIEGLERGKAYLFRQLDKQVDHIANCENLLEEWKKFGQASCDAKTSDMLLAETDQLLEEGANK